MKSTRTPMLSRHRQTTTTTKTEQTNPSFSTNPKDELPFQPVQDEPSLLGTFDESEHERGKVLGNGAFGQVHRLDPKQEGGKTLALKTAFTGHDDDLQHEGKVLDRLGQHENIVGFEGTGTDKDGSSTLALEFLGGGNVQAMQKRLSEAFAARKISHEQYWGTMQYLMRGITSGIGHMNDKGMVHGDLKFENVGLSDDMTPKVLDFGTARNIGEEGHGATTPDVNFAPERATAQTIHGTNDMYAIGQMTHKAGLGDYYGTGTTQYGTMYNRGEEHRKARQGELESPFTAPTAFDEFLGGTLNPLPENRATPQQALEHSFLSDGLLDDEQAKLVLMQMHDDKQNNVQYGGAKSELELVEESRNGREQRLEQARIQNKEDKLSGKEALKEAKRGHSRKDIGNKSSMLKELKKKTRGTRKALDKDAETRRKSVGR